MTSPNAVARVGQYINGEHVRGTGETFDVIEPASGRPLATVETCSPQELDRAVACAAQAAASWRSTRSSSKIARMNRWADAISANRDELAELEARESGKPLSLCTALVAAAAARVRNAAGWIDKLSSDRLPLDAQTLCYTEREPYGVVAAIIPWNFPAGNFVGKAAPAIAAGNAVVVKPAEQTPLVAMRLAELSRETGFPPGLLSVVNGDGPSVGAHLVSHPSIKKIAFTGSSATGVAITQSTGAIVKSFTLELGGKSANIVMPDADLDSAVEAAAYTAFLHAGQVCTSGSRLLLHESIAADFLTRLVALAESLVVGDPMRAETHIGPIISFDQLDQVQAKVRGALAQGATLLTGGNRLTPPGCEGGSFFAPTILANVDRESRIFNEEVFGPVLAVKTFTSFDEAIELANQTDYGLAAIIWTKDLRTAYVGASQLEAGIIWVNTVQLLDNAVPYGGYGQSGIGVESGLDGLLDFMQSKSVFMNTGVWRSPWS